MSTHDPLYLHQFTDARSIAAIPHTQAGVPMGDLASRPIFVSEVSGIPTAPNFAAIRTVAAAGGADLEPPALADPLWVALSTLDAAVEWYANLSVIGGGTPPTTTTVRLWRRVGGSTGTVQLLDEFTRTSVDWTAESTNGRFYPRTSIAFAQDVQATFTFSDGVAPVVTGTIQARAVNNETKPVRSDPFPTQPVAFGPNYSLLRNFAGNIADVDPPVAADGLWVALEPDALVEWMPDLTAISGVVAPSQVTLKLWERVGTLVRMVDSITLDTAQWVAYGASKAFRPRFARAITSRLQCTAAFPDGTTQSITGNVYARPSTLGHGLQRGDLIWNQATGHPVVEPRGYDAVSDAERTFEISPEFLNYQTDLIESTAGALVAGVVYLPATTGMQGMKNIHCDFAITAGVTSAITVTFEASNDPAFTTPLVDITLSGYDTGAGIYLAGGIVIAATTAVTKGIDFDNFNYDYFRIKCSNAGANPSTACTVRVRRMP